MNNCKTHTLKIKEFYVIIRFWQILRNSSKNLQTLGNGICLPGKKELHKNSVIK